jgi:hypothetical protein
MYRWASRASLAVGFAASALTLVTVSGVFPRSQVGPEHPTSTCLFGFCGRVANEQGSTSWFWISDNWPADAGTRIQLQPGRRSRDYLKDTDSIGIPEHCRATDGDGRHFAAGWHKITDWYDGHVTVTCDPPAADG